MVTLPKIDACVSAGNNVTIVNGNFVSTVIDDEGMKTLVSLLQASIQPPPTATNTTGTLIPIPANTALPLGDVLTQCFEYEHTLNKYIVSDYHKAVRLADEVLSWLNQNGTIPVEASAKLLILIAQVRMYQATNADLPEIRSKFIAEADVLLFRVRNVIR